MSITLDSTTWAEYSAQTLASSRANLIRDALTAPVTITAFRAQQGGPVTIGSGTMAEPWCSASGSTITIGEVNATKFTVATTTLLDGSCYLRFTGANGRYLQGGLGGPTAGSDFTSTQATLIATAKATIGTISFAVSGAADPAPAGAPVLITPVSISKWRGGTPSNVGDVAIVNYALWQDQYPLVMSGTIGPGNVPGEFQFYLGPSASSVPNLYALEPYFLTFSGMKASPGQWSQITAYNATTKVATVGWWPGEGTDPVGDRLPPIGRTWKLFHDYPIQRQFRWYRNGVLIPGVRADVYTMQNADAGKTVTVKEIAGFIPATTNAGTRAYPTVTSESISAGIAVNAGSADPDLIGADDFQYVGSFLVGTSYPNASGFFVETNVRGVSVLPPSRSVSGQRSLLLTGRFAGTFVQMTIPPDSQLGTPATVPNWYNLNFSTLTHPAQGPSAPGMSSMAYDRAIPDGLDPNNGTVTSRTQRIPGTNKFLFTIFNPYSGQPVAYTYRADLNFNPASIEGPVIICDPVKGPNARAFAGGSCEIPASLRTALGGNIIVANPASSIVSNNSDGPALLAFDTANFDAALAKAETGIARGGSLSTIQLAASAAGTTSNYYDGFFVQTSTNTQSVKVASYNPATKTITTLTGDFGFFVAPTNGVTYKLIPPLIGDAFVFHPLYSFETVNSGEVSPIYNNSNGMGSAVLPSGTRSALVMGFGPQGPYIYGANGAPDNDQVMRGYDPNNPSGQGQHQSVSAEEAGFKVWAYDTDDLAAVRAGTLSINDILPYGVFKIANPYDEQGLKTGISPQAYAYDQETRRLYIVQTMPNSSATPICHVYSITSASTEVI